MKAPVPTPLDWREVTTTLLPADFNLGNFATRLEAPDPWIDLANSRESLEHGSERLKNLDAAGWRLFQFKFSKRVRKSFFRNVAIQMAGAI
jgi:hypothetical protein